MGIEDDDIETTYPAPKSAELPQPGPGDPGPDGIELPANLDGHASGDPTGSGQDAGVDTVLVDPHGPGDAGAAGGQGGLDDGGADHGPTGGPADQGPGETLVEGQHDTGADGQVP